MEDKIEVGEYEEVWKDVKGYEGLYQVSNLGKVRSLFRYKKRLKPCKSNIGYEYVNLYKNNKMKRISIHKLVAENFIMKPILEINHKDGDKTNNCVDNLEWVTPKENVIHRFKVLKQEPFRKYKQEKINHSTREGRNKYARIYYQKNKKRILKYQKEWRNKRKFCKCRI